MCGRVGVRWLNVLKKNSDFAQRQKIHVIEILQGLLKHGNVLVPKTDDSTSSLRAEGNRTHIIETRQTVAGPWAHRWCLLLGRKETIEGPCQLSSCTTDCNYLAWFWPGLGRYSSVPTQYRVPSSWCHQPITESPVPSSGLTCSPIGFHPAQRQGLCQELKMHGFAPTAVRSHQHNSTKTNSNKVRATFHQHPEYDIDQGSPTKFDGGAEFFWADTQRAVHSNKIK